MARVPGIRFYPTDVELFMYYLKRKVMGKSLQPEMISEVKVYQFEPWDLPTKSCLKTKDLIWFFFCPRVKRYPNGGRANRSTERGYWKATGIDRTVKYKDRPVGKIKTLIFHQGKAPHGERTDWVMLEYRLEDQVLAERGVPQDSYVICKVYKKSGAGPKNGEHHGAPFVEEEWESDNDDGNMEMDGRSDTQNASVVTTDLHSPNFASIASTPSVEQWIASDLQSPSGATVSVSTPSTQQQEQQKISFVATQNIETVSTPSTHQQKLSYVGTQNVETVSTASTKQQVTTVVAPPNVAMQLPLLDSALLAPTETGDELDRLLATFLDDDLFINVTDNDFFNGLEDLPEFSDGYLDLSDLQ